MYTTVIVLLVIGFVALLIGALVAPTVWLSQSRKTSREISILRWVATVAEAMAAKKMMGSPITPADDYALQVALNELRRFDDATYDTGEDSRWAVGGFATKRDGVGDDASKPPRSGWPRNWNR